jgi:hypothetical protein
MSKYKKIDISQIKTLKVEERSTKADISGLGKPSSPETSLAEFLGSLPHYLKARDLLVVAERIASAHRTKKPVIWMMGAHPIKVGLSDILNDLIERGFITHLAVNGAFAIHDLEMAFFGRTSEEVAEGLSDGTFGMVEETPKLIFEAAQFARKNDLGLGEGFGKYICENAKQFGDHSVLGACYSKGVPATVHIAIGTDTICQHPGYDGALFGELSHGDFHILCESVGHLSDGVVLNIGSAVLMPEVFLKALTVARNIYGDVANFTAANFDMIQHYRPNVNVTTRPVAGSGQGFSFTGHHEIMIPLLAAAIKDKFYEGNRK